MNIKKNKLFSKIYIMYNILESINDLINTKNINTDYKNVLDKIKELPSKYSVIDNTQFNEFYNFEKNTKISKKKDNENILFFPEKTLDINYDIENIKNISEHYKANMKNIINREKNYTDFLQTNLPKVKNQKLPTNNLLNKIIKYIKLEFDNSNLIFDDKYCFKHIETFSMAFNSLKSNNLIAKNDQEKIKIIQIYNNELNIISQKSLEVIENYNIEALIINPDLKKLQKIDLTKLQKTDLTKIINLQNNLLFTSYDIDNDLIFNIIDKFIISNYDLMVDTYLRLDDTPKINDINNLLKRLGIDNPRYLLEEFDRLKSIIIDDEDLNILASFHDYFKFIDTIEKNIYKIIDINKNIINLKKNKINDYIKYYYDIQNNINKINDEIKLFNIDIDEISKEINVLRDYYQKKTKNLVTKNSIPENKINSIIKKYYSLIKFLEKHNNLMDDKQKNSKNIGNYLDFKIELDDTKQNYDALINFLKIYINKDQSGGFNDYFDNIVDISLSQNNNLAHKIRFNNLLFFSHILFIINYTQMRDRQIIQKINLDDVNKYLQITNDLLAIIKLNNNILGTYFLKYHYFNLKIINNFLAKLKNNWNNVNILPNECNEEIIKINVYKYFNLLNKNYTPSMKKAIFIFIALKPILDKL